MTRLSACAILLLIVVTGPRALADPLYTLSDLGAVSAGHDVQFGTDANGQGYVTNTDGQVASPFPRSTITLTPANDPYSIDTAPFTYGTVVHRDFQTSQGVIAGTAYLSPSSSYGWLGDTTFFWQPYGEGLRYVSQGQKGYISMDDINSSAVAVGMQPLGPSWDLSTQKSPAVLSPFNQTGPLAYVDLIDVVKVPGWNLVLPARQSIDALQIGPMRIDDLGRIVGYGYDNGSLHAYLLTPSSLPPSANPVPEPTSLAVFATVAISILVSPTCRRRRALKQETDATGE